MPLAPPPGFDAHSVYRTLFAAYPDALLVVDGGGTIVLANPMAATLLGYSVDELIGLPVDALVPESIRPRHAAFRGAYGRDPRPRPMGSNMDLVAVRRDGSQVMVEIALSPLQEHGLPYVVAAIRSIAEYPRVKQALQRARYAEYVAQMGRLAVDTRDPHHLLQQVPAVAAEALQVGVSVVFLLEPNGLEFRVAGGVGLVPGELNGALVPNRADTPPGFVLSAGVPVVVSDYRNEQRFVVPPSYRESGLVSALAVPLSDRGNRVGALTVRSREPQRFGDDEVHFLQSLANLLAASLQRVQTEEALNHAQRLESVGQLTGGIAHDFNNLLTVIQGNLQVLEEHPALKDDAYGQQLVAAASRASRRGAELTGKLLAFSRRQVLKPTRVDASAMLQSLADMLRRALDQRIQIEVEASPSCPPCLADAGQLESALLNIAINARDAMPSGGRLSFACRRCELLPADLRANLPGTASNYVEISVADTGSGMSEAIRERAFEPFFTTKEAGRGTGLGLSTVYGFVRQSQGGISLDTAPGHGTRVTMYIPRFREGDDDDTGVLPAEATLPPGLRVLLVEDEPEVRQVVRNFLETLGCRVTTSASGEQALLTLPPHGEFDLLLTDIALGAGMRGTELAQRAQEADPRLPVLLMSGFSAELLDGDGESAPPWELLRKPYTRDDLARAIGRALAGRASSVPRASD
jgi:PAS domain S-box-containing protein